MFREKEFPAQRFPGCVDPLTKLSDESVGLWCRLQAVRRTAQRRRALAAQARGTRRCARNRAPRFYGAHQAAALDSRSTSGFLGRELSTNACDKSVKLSAKRPAEARGYPHSPDRTKLPHLRV